MRRLRTRPAVLLLALAAAVVLMVSAFRPWVSGSVDDAVLGTARVSALGSEAAPGVTAVALALAASAVATVAGGRVVRWLAILGYAGCLLLAAALAGRALLDPADILGPIAARSAGRTGSIETNASATAWPWVALVAVGIGVVGLTGALAGIRGWSGPSARYERPTPSASGSDLGSARGPAPAEQTDHGGGFVSAWDDLTQGRDPTADDTDAADVRRDPAT